MIPALTQITAYSLLLLIVSRPEIVFAAAMAPMRPQPTSLTAQASTVYLFFLLRLKRDHVPRLRPLARTGRNGVLGPPVPLLVELSSMMEQLPSELDALPIPQLTVEFRSENETATLAR